MDALEKLGLVGLVPVIKIEDAADAVPLCQALCEGGLPVAEITFRTAAAEEAIRRVRAALPGTLLGAGTVLTVDQARRALDAGATYLVSPGLNPTVVGWAVKNGVPILPGCATPSDIEAALGFGLKAVKFFPAEALGGLKLIKAMSAPYGGVSFVPTGGIDEKNAGEYLAFDRVLAIGGSWMAPSDAIRAKDWARITHLAAEAVKCVLGLKLQHIGINAENAEAARADALLFAKLMGLPVAASEKSTMVGDAFEFMNATGRGQRGHIAISTNSVERAMFHLKLRGFTFEDAPIGMRDVKIAAIYLKDEIAGFAVHLLRAR
jgi:2-dehydro-3-deoxyphosphogluconate aldolase/(4S)-4-hydroxy-2-oxoglutarate aldolase